jgi:hypothetical protein
LVGILSKAKLCRDAMLQVCQAMLTSHGYLMMSSTQVTCNTCTKFKKPEAAKKCRTDPKSNSNAKIKCKHCRDRGVVCNWGDEIPLEMGPIKIAIHRMQWEERYGTGDGAGKGLENQIKGNQITVERIVGDGISSVEGAISEVVMGDTEGTAKPTIDNTIGKGAGTYPKDVHLSDEDLCSRTRTALIAALAEREERRRVANISVAATLERLRISE